MIESNISPLDRRIFSDHLTEDEELLDVFHRHWVALVPSLAGVLVPGLIVIFLLFAALPPTPQLLIGGGLALLALLGWAAVAAYDWYCDVFLLTSQNLILIDWQNPFRVSVERIEYDSIDIVKHERHGIISTILDFGALIITTANAQHTLRTVQNPEQMQERMLAIRDHVSSSGEEDGQLDVETLRKALKALLAERDGEEAEGEPPPRKPPEPPQVSDVRPPA